MMEALQPQNLAIVGRNGSIPGATGDGIKACIWVGAKFDDTHSMMMFDRAALKPDAVPGREQTENGESGFFWMGSQPFLKVNSKGERFFNDSGGYFSGTYPNLSTGAACGRTVTFGRRAGRIAATEGI